jgi:hypothetical protein
MPVSSFGNFLQLARSQPLLGPDEIINDASKHTYTVGKMIKNRPGQAIQGGSNITERVKLLARNSYREYLPGEERNPGRSNTLVPLTWPYRFAESDIAYTQAEVEMAVAKDGQKTAYKNLRRSLRMDAAQDHWDGIESRLWRVPSYTDMELDTAGAAGKPYSIPAYITESTTHTAPGWTNTNNLAGAAPATYENWRNQREDYDSANPFGDNGIFAAMDRMFLDLRWDQAPRNKEAFEDPGLDRLMVFTNKEGVTLFSQGLRNANDSTRAGPQDPAYGKPQFNGVPIDWSAELDTNLLDQASDSYTTQAYPTGKPRYFFINAKYMYPVFHRSYFMAEKGPFDGGARQWDTEALFYVSWWNLICTSRRRQGIVFPE